MEDTRCIGGLSDAKWGSQYHQQDRVYSMGQCALALPAQIPEGSYKYMEIKAIGKLSNSNQRNVVYDKNAVSPTIQAALGEGGGNCPLVVDDIKVIGKMDHTMDHTFESANRVYGTQGICPTLPTCGGGNIQPKIMECVAMRGRNPENPSDRRPGIELEQRLEVREDNCVGTITTVQKDNMVLIRQATKEGTIPCEVGGGMRSELPGQQNSQMKGARQRTDMPDSDNGEYP